MSFSYVKNAGKFLCIGRNYLAHIKELNNAKPSEPFFFLKPKSSVLLPKQGPVLVPRGTIVHHEVELACVVGKTLRDLDPASFTPSDALDAIKGYALAIDMSARNVQDEMKKKGLPWTIPKGFDTFLPLSGFIGKDQIADPYNVELNLTVNGQTRQKDMTNLMIFPIHRILTTMSSIMTIEEGDVILTGTPKGVGSIVPGDKIEAWAEVDGKRLPESVLELDVAEKPGPYFYQAK
ncbi:hypothetical protein KL918_003840 [Ogataea parapolymorpha]|uniref:Acylpyruvase FAHD1, mitochondrial n=1 Tax=Ogataea parapolymorpha (strain ATCC 26012 / BCRC 20466 / JCM 22074 / NRRL Y-7560 / DL-1) TaxID=871575 RepID=W1QKA3_OGAPD|nr:Acylpyruvase FAHD1, mitochondrial [Ogataea parapolymorpha DL-1]ESX02293.1 Acylpyruvase FAHD1, mitochondrial [Ogataea parapolymorpha DL-1]KAG7866375.1 hypothetical protein KL918_003840 [Ogataea parapolymorpha]KAG7873003.1 hypothetical protein KL916_002733 [Ogataea parapolymorpha]